MCSWRLSSNNPSVFLTTLYFDILCAILPTSCIKPYYCQQLPVAVAVAVSSCCLMLLLLLLFHDACIITLSESCLFMFCCSFMLWFCFFIINSLVPGKKLLEACLYNLPAPPIKLHNVINQVLNVISRLLKYCCCSVFLLYVCVCLWLLLVHDAVVSCQSVADDANNASFYY